MFINIDFRVAHARLSSGSNCAIHQNKDEIGIGAMAIFIMTGSSTKLFDKGTSLRWRFPLPFEIWAQLHFRMSRRTWHIATRSSCDCPLRHSIFPLTRPFSFACIREWPRCIRANLPYIFITPHPKTHHTHYQRWQHSKTSLSGKPHLRRKTLEPISSEPTQKTSSTGRDS